MLTSGSEAGASTAKSVAGTYTVHAVWTGRGGWQAWSMTLNRDHTGTSEFGDTIVWSNSGRSFSMTLNSVATFVGTKTKAGFSSLAHLGTMSNTSGRTGVWYAITTP